ncbi:MAG: CHRD domain-containing protein [Cyanothece sp. SIO1E1]|nr:CHRD domain-containing protein [Cyanothece sp. SIO1E1]
MIDVDPSSNTYFSYASMVIPSNDAFIANGSPTAHPLFDAEGNFIATPFYVTGIEALDAGTEVNDELPANTAFFGQAAPNTGVDENGVVALHPGFNEGPGGILDADMFFNADFLQDNVNLMRFSFATFDRERPLILTSDLATTFQVPSPTVDGSPTGQAFILLTNGGTEFLYLAFLDGLSGDATAAHLHLGPITQTGPVVAELRTFGDRFLFGRIREDGITGPLGNTESPIGSLIAEMIGGNVYFNVHTEANPQGEIRGQVTLY